MHCYSWRFMTATVIALTISFVQPGWAASNFQVLHSFPGSGTDGIYPAGALAFDKSGSLYGTTHTGGILTYCPDTPYNLGCGVAFQLSPGSNGHWTEAVLHRFQSGSDGAVPNGSLILDDAGNIYGTTQLGGMANQDECGTIFRLTPNKTGRSETIIYTFCSQVYDGYFPRAGLIADTAGNLWGTTSSGGQDLGGIVFELTPSGKSWTSNILWNFCVVGSCFAGGANPIAGLIADSAGNLYSTALMGGNSEHYCGGFPGGCGAVFELTPSNGEWTEKVLYAFLGFEGVEPAAKVTFDDKGNIYGTTGIDGALGYGTVFRLAPSEKGGWKYSVLYNFHAGPNGFNTGVVIDASGNLYGAQTFGGSAGCGGFGCGVVYKLTPTAHGVWKYSVVHQFSGFGDGGEPSGDLIFGPDGRLYGVAGVGGSGGSGVVFAITP
jgi:uncharacterized repeat protein (TIGR03803 family)